MIKLKYPNKFKSQIPISKSQTNPNFLPQKRDPASYEMIGGKIPKSQPYKFRSLIICSLVIVCNLVLGYWNLTLCAQDKIVAIINKDAITQKDLDDFINFMRLQLSTEYQGRQLESKIQSMKLDLIDKLIADRLILQEAKKNKIQIDPGRVKARIQEMKKHYVSERDFQDALAKQGLVQADIETKIKEQLLMYAVIDIKIKNKIIVNPAEVTDFYQENVGKFKIPEKREFESVTISNKELAQEVFDKLKSGQDFQEVAKNYSLVVNKFNSVQDVQLRKDIGEQIFKLHTGEISKPIKIEDRYYIFKLDNIIPARQQNLSEAQDNVYAFLFNKKMEEGLAKWLDELKKHAYIKIM